MGMHPLWWGLLAVFMIAGVGLYAETVGFYELDDFNEEYSDDHKSDHEDDNGDNQADDSEDGLTDERPFKNPDEESD